jgi:general stress protein YciG
MKEDILREALREIGRLGGKASAKALTDRQRTERARKAGKARQAKARKTRKAGTR